MSNKTITSNKHKSVQIDNTVKNNAAESNAESYDIVIVNEPEEQLADEKHDQSADDSEVEDKVESEERSIIKTEVPLVTNTDTSDLELHKIIDEDGDCDEDGNNEENDKQETVEKPVDQETNDRADNLAENTENNLSDNLMENTEDKSVDHDETAETTPVKKVTKKTTKPVKIKTVKKTTPVKKTTKKAIAKKTSHPATKQSYGNIDQSEPYDYKKYLAERKSYGDCCDCESDDSDCDHSDVKANYDKHTMKCIEEDELAYRDMEYIMSKHNNFYAIEREKLKSRNNKLVTCVLHMLDVFNEASGEYITTIEDFYRHSAETLKTLNKFKYNKYAVFFIAYCLKEWFLACKNKYSTCNFTFQRETMCQYAIRAYRMGCKESLSIIIFYLTYKHKKIAATKYDERHMNWENEKICQFFGSMTNRELFDIMLYGPALSSRTFYDSMLLELVMKKQKTIEQMKGCDDK